MPGPTYAPFFRAAGVFLPVPRLVFPGPLLFIGLVASSSRFFWGREALREYDHAAEEHPQPAVVRMRAAARGPHAGPVVPADPRLDQGLPAPSSGWSTPGWIIAVGIGFLIASLLGWLNDAGKEGTGRSTRMRPGTHRERPGAALAERSAGDSHSRWSSPWR
jgi:hypothetical protein